MATAWASIDLDAVAENVRQLCELVAPAAVCAVVKADGYGHGAIPVARTAVNAGATWLAVAHVGEGEALRDAGLDVPILVLAEPEPTDLPRVVSAGLSVTMYSEAGIGAASSAATAARSPLGVHLKVDTGMHRVGAHPAAVVDLARRVVDDPWLRFDALWTHLAVADEPGNEFTSLQLDRFRATLEELVSQGFVPAMRHAANSAGAIAHPDARFDLVRCGMPTYGIAPAPALDDRVVLRPALSLCARVAQVKSVPAGDAISYGLRHRFEHDATVATVAIGYADGVRRDSYVRGVEVLVGGRRCPIVGTVTMDQIMVDCTGVEVAVGDVAVLIGRQGDGEITAAEIADRLGTIPYEVVCNVGPRVERRWCGGDDLDA